MRKWDKFEDTKPSIHFNEFSRCNWDPCWDKFAMVIPHSYASYMQIHCKYRAHEMPPFHPCKGTGVLVNSQSPLSFFFRYVYTYIYMCVCVCVCVCVFVSFRKNSISNPSGMTQVYLYMYKAWLHTSRLLQKIGVNKFSTTYFYGPSLFYSLATIQLLKFWPTRI